jgi:hypothetical protein
VLEEAKSEYASNVPTKTATPAGSWRWAPVATLHLHHELGVMLPDRRCGSGEGNPARGGRGGAPVGGRGGGGTKKKTAVNEGPPPPGRPPNKKIQL